MSTSKSLTELISSVGGDTADLPFWEGCRSGQFLLHCCNICNRHYWPASRCIEHGDIAMQWVESSGRGQLYTYTVMHRVLSPTFKDKAPYVVGVIQMDEGPLFHSNVIQCEHDQVYVGMRLRCSMTEHSNGMTIPQFQPE